MVDNLNFNTSTKALYLNLSYQIQILAYKTIKYKSKNAKQKISFRQNSQSSNEMLQAFKKRWFYDAVRIYKQKLENNGDYILFIQKLCVYRMKSLYLTINFAFREMENGKNLRKWILNELQINFTNWRKAIIHIFLGSADFILDLRELQRLKNHFYKEQMLKQEISNINIREVLQFLIWTTTKEKEYAQQIICNLKVIRESMAVFDVNFREKNFKSTCAHSSKDFKRVIENIHELIYQIKNTDKGMIVDKDSKTKNLEQTYDERKDIVTELQRRYVFLHQQLQKIK